MDVEPKHLLGHDLDAQKGRECSLSDGVKVAIASSFGDNGSVVDYDGDIILESYPEVEVSSRRGRKREREEDLVAECVVAMLNWVKGIAKNPCDPAVGRALQSSTKSELEVGYLKQVLIIQEALRLRHPCFNPESYLLQKRQKMHPSMYEDCASSDNQHKIRCSERLLFQHSGPHSSSISETFSAPSDSEKNMNLLRPKNDLDKEVIKNLGSSTAEAVVRLFCKEQKRIRVRVGSHFQAKLPEWTGLASDSDDSKWLGTQMWPPKPEEHSSLFEQNPIGKGRSDFCSCNLRGSFECVRFHVAEKRIQLKSELGSAFYEWRFDRMGEEVSLSWTHEEERCFKAIVHQNPPSQDKCFWDEIYRGFHSKSRQSLLNYYFDVFLLRRRSYQNHVTPNHIDSDDEDSDWFSASSDFGCDTLIVQGFGSMICSQNMQSFDID